MPDVKTKEQEYEEFIKAFQGGDIGKAKYFWSLIEKVLSASDITGKKIEEIQNSVKDFIKTFKDRKDGKDGKDGYSPTPQEVLKLMRPLIPKPKNGKTPTREELLSLIKSVMPKPIPGPRGPEGKQGKAGPRNRLPKHEWSGTLIRFENPDGSWGEWKNLQGPAGQAMERMGGSMAGLIKVVGSNFVAEGVLKLVLGSNITPTKIPGGGVRLDASGGGITEETPSGDVDDSNTSFTVVHEPLFINVNGAIYPVGVGLYQSYVGGTITLSSPVGSGGFLRSYYA